MISSTKSQISLQLAPKRLSTQSRLSYRTCARDQKLSQKWEQSLTHVSKALAATKLHSRMSWHTISFVICHTFLKYSAKASVWGRLHKCHPSTSFMRTRRLAQSLSRRMSRCCFTWMAFTWTQISGSARQSSYRSASTRPTRLRKHHQDRSDTPMLTCLSVVARASASARTSLSSWVKLTSPWLISSSTLDMLKAPLTTRIRSLSSWSGRATTRRSGLSSESANETKLEITTRCRLSS